MKDVEKKFGLISFYGTLKNKSQYDSDISYTFNAISIYGGSKNAHGAVPVGEYPTEYANAVGLNGDEARGHYEYYLVSYEFMPKPGEWGVQHAIVAKNKDTGKHLVLGTLPPSNHFDDGSQMKAWMQRREKALDLAVSKYTSVRSTVDNDADAVATTKLYINGDENNPPLINTQKEVLHNQPDEINRKNYSRGRKRYDSNFQLISKISDFHGDFLEGLTVGAPVSSSDAVTDALYKNKLFPDPGKRYQQGEFVRTQITDTTVVDNLNNRKLKSSADVAMKSGLFKLFGTKDSPTLIGEVDGHRMIVVETTRGSIPFFYNAETEEWVPAIGYVVKDGKPELAPEFLDKTNRYYDKELAVISRRLKGLSWANKAKVTKGVSKNFVQALLKYSDEDLYSPDRHSDLRRSFDKKTNIFVGNVRISLRDARKLWKPEHLGGPTSYTEPYVITRGEHAGKTVIFYTFDKTKDLGEMSEQEVVNLYNGMMKTAKTLESPFSTNRDGIGYIILDSKPMSMREIYDLYHNGDTSDIAKNLNRIVVQGAAEERLIGMLAVLHKHLSGERNMGRRAKELASKYEGIADVSKISKEKNQATRTFLEKMFNEDNLGKIGLSGLSDAERGALDQAITTASKYIDLAPEEASNAIRTELEGTLSTEYKDALKSLGIEDLGDYERILEFTIVDGKGENGKIALDESGNPAVTVRKSTVIKYISDETLGKLGAAGTKMTAGFNLEKFFMMLDTEANNDATTIGAVLDIIDKAILSTEGLEKKLMVSPIIKDTKNPIAKAQRSSNVALEDVLDTNVKQITRPSIIVNLKLVNDNIDEYLMDVPTTTGNGGGGTGTLAGKTDVEVAIDTLDKLGKEAKSLNEVTKDWAAFKPKIKQDAKAKSAYVAAKAAVKARLKGEGGGGGTSSKLATRENFDKKLKSRTFNVHTHKFTEIIPNYEKAGIKVKTILDNAQILINTLGNSEINSKGLLTSTSEQLLKLTNLSETDKQIVEDFITYTKKAAKIGQKALLPNKRYNIKKAAQAFMDAVDSGKVSVTNLGLTEKPLDEAASALQFDVGVSPENLTIPLTQYAVAKETGNTAKAAILKSIIDNYIKGEEGKERVVLDSQLLAEQLMLPEVAATTAEQLSPNQKDVLFAREILGMTSANEKKVIKQLEEQGEKPATSASVLTPRQSFALISRTLEDKNYVETQKLLETYIRDAEKNYYNRDEAKSMIVTKVTEWLQGIKQEGALINDNLLEAMSDLTNSTITIETNTIEVDAATAISASISNDAIRQLVESTPAYQALKSNQMDLNKVKPDEFANTVITDIQLDAAMAATLPDDLPSDWSDQLAESLSKVTEKCKG